MADHNRRELSSLIALLAVALPTAAGASSPRDESLAATKLSEAREAVVHALAEYGAIKLHHQAEPPAQPSQWDFWLTPTPSGAPRPGNLKIYDGTAWGDVTPQSFAAAILAKGLPQPAPGLLANDGAGRLSWVGSPHLCQPAHFGAVGDGVHDDTAALQKLAASGCRAVSLGAGKTYLIKDTIAFPAGCDLDFASSQIVYAGPRNRPAVIHGGAGLLNGATISRVKIRAQTIDWSNIDFVGLRVINLSRGRVTGDFIVGFTVGHEAYSLGQGYTHAYHQILAINNCKYGTVLTCDGSAPGINYVNENIWDGGDCTNHSATLGLGSCYGVWLRAINGGYTGHDMNRWFCPCFQMGDGKPGDERIPFFFDNCGNRCTVTNARYESGRGPFARLHGGYVVLNKLEAGIVSGDFVTPSIVETGIARFNTASFQEQLHVTRSGVLSVNVAENVHAYGNGEIAVTGGLHVTDSSGAAALSVPASLGIKPRLSSIELTSQSVSVGFFARTIGSETFTLLVDGETGHLGILGVALFDSNFMQLTDRSTTFPDFIYGTFGGDRPYTYSGSFGGSYRGGYKTPPGTLSFRVGPAVRYMRLFVTGLGARIRSIGLERLTPSSKLMTLYNPLPVRTETRYVAGDPSTGTIGVYSAGDILPMAAAARNGPAFFQCTRSGRLAPPWEKLTSYAVEDIVQSFDNIYACTRGGPSGNSIGPQGAGASISDGSAVWRSVGPKAMFVAR
jgi:hypothetical protein